MAIDYESYWEKGSYKPTTLGSEFWESIRESLPKKRFSLLDFGCGNGAAADDLRNIECSYQGVDVSVAGVEIAKKAGHSCQVCMPGHALPFEDETFDVILSSCVVEHIVDAFEAYKPLYSLLRPGGILIVRTNNMMHWRLRLDYLLLGRWNPYGDELSVEQPWRDPHVRFFTADSLSRFLLTLGYLDVKVTGDSGRCLQWVPYVGRLCNSESSAISKKLSATIPGIFAGYITAIGIKPSRSKARKLI